MLTEGWEVPTDFEQTSIAAAASNGFYSEEAERSILFAGISRRELHEDRQGAFYQAERH